MKKTERNDMGVFLDTGFILAFKNKDDKNFTTAQSWMKLPVAYLYHLIKKYFEI